MGSEFPSSPSIERLIDVSRLDVVSLHDGLISSGSELCDLILNIRRKPLINMKRRLFGSANTLLF